MSHPDGKQMIQDFHYPAQALPAQPTSPNPSGLTGSTMPWRLTRWEADLHYDREDSEDASFTTNIDQAAPPSIPQWPLPEADYDNRKDIKNRSDSVVPDPSKLPRPLIPVMTSAADPAVLTPIGS